MKDGTLYICGQPWDVVFTEQALWHEGKAAHALCHRHAMRIEVCVSDIPEAAVRCTLWYEVGRALFHTIFNGYPETESDCVQVFGVGMESIYADKRNRWFLGLIEGDNGIQEKRKR